jgi:ribose transport system substrate-binding protein
MNQDRVMKLPRHGRRGTKFTCIVALGALALAGCSTISSQSSGSKTGANKAVNPKNLLLVESVRSLSNPYHAQWVKGGQMFADSVGAKLTVLTDEGDSQKQLSGISSLANSGKTIVLNVDPNTNSDTQAIVRTVSAAGGYVVTQWNKPAGFEPWGVGNNWVSHISFDGNVGGEQVANTLFTAMGGSGGIIALQGILDNVSSQQRFTGLNKALSSKPGIKLLDQQTANWDRNQAFKVTQTLLSKYGNKVKGVWAANDNMALGAIQALNAAGMLGKVPIVSASDAVPEALQDIKAGKDGLLATVSTDAYWQGGAAMALAYDAAIGKIDVNKLTHEQRAFYGTQLLVTKANVDKVLTPPTAESLKADFADPFKRMTGAIGN